MPGYIEYIYSRSPGSQPYSLSLPRKLTLNKTRYQYLYTFIMSSSIKNLAFIALATGLASVASAQSESGSGTTTRYWYG